MLLWTGYLIFKTGTEGHQETLLSRCHIYMSFSWWIAIILQNLFSGYLKHSNSCCLGVLLPSLNNLCPQVCVLTVPTVPAILGVALFKTTASQGGIETEGHNIIKSFSSSFLKGTPYLLTPYPPSLPAPSNHLCTLHIWRRKRNIHSCFHIFN